MRIDKAYAKVLVEKLTAFTEDRLEIYGGDGWMKPADIGLKTVPYLSDPTLYRVVSEKPKTEKAKNDSKRDRSKGRLATSQNRKRKIFGKAN